VSLQDSSKERVTCKTNQQPLCDTEIPSHRKEYVVLEKTKRTITKQGTLNLYNISWAQAWKFQFHFLKSSGVCATQHEYGLPFKK